MKKKIIYLDCAATKKVFEEVVMVMNEFHLEKYGNPSSLHILGEEAMKNIIEAKKTIAKRIGAKASEIIFTSGGTESNNLAIRGLALANPDKKKIIISTIEHHSVLEECLYLKSKGYIIIEIPVNSQGMLDLEQLENNIDSNTLLVSIIHGHNEIGTIQEIGVIGEICKAHGAILHTDAVQSFLKTNINVKEMKIDLLSGSAHKVGGPKGVGFLYIKDGLNIKPIIMGGGQERGLRSGTENVAGIMGFSKAVEINERISKNEIKILSDYFLKNLEKLGAELNGHRERRIYNNINVSFKGVNSDDLILKLSERGIMCSTKSACSSKEKIENRVMKAIGKKSNGVVRFSIDENINKKDIDKVISILKKEIN